MFKKAMTSKPKTLSFYVWNNHISLQEPLLVTLKLPLNAIKHWTLVATHRVVRVPASHVLSYITAILTLSTDTDNSLFLLLTK